MSTTEDKLAGAARAHSPPRVVLDTNVVLDWLLFDDPPGRSLGRAVEAGRLEWIATPEMRAEYFEVLARAALARWAPDAAAHHRAWSRWCRPTLVEATRPAPRILCADVDDQMFVDLALAEGAAWLLSRDRALLVLASALGTRGVIVTTPAAWADMV